MSLHVPTDTPKHLRLQLAASAARMLVFVNFRLNSLITGLRGAVFYSMYHRLNIIYNFRGFLCTLNTNVPLFANGSCKLSVAITISIYRYAEWCKQVSFFHSYFQMSFDRCRFFVTLLFYSDFRETKYQGYGDTGCLPAIYHMISVARFWQDNLCFKEHYFGSIILLSKDWV